MSRQSAVTSSTVSVTITQCQRSLL